MDKNKLRSKYKKLKSVFTVILAIVMVTAGLVTSPTTQVQAAKGVSAKSISLNKTVYTLEKGKKVTLKGTISPKNATNNKITWKTSDKSVAAIDNKGVVTAKKNGNATITATVRGTKISSKCKIIVGIPVKTVSVKNTNVTLEKGKTALITTTIAPKNATTKTVTYTSSKPAVASVNSKGKITAKAVGTATITVKSNDGTGKTAKVKVTVKKESTEKITVDSIEITSKISNMYVGGTIQLEVNILPQNATNKNVNWSSSNKSIATVANGLVKAVSEGKVTITATTVDGNKTAAIDINVLPANTQQPSSGGPSGNTDSGLPSNVPVTNVSLNKNEATIAIGEEIQLSASITPSNATNKKITWVSSDSSIAQVDTSGKVIGKAQGNAQITVTTENGNKTATCNVIVEKSAIVSTSSELIAALSAGMDRIIYTSEAQESIEIESGTYNNTTLIVNAPNATFTNNALFKGVIIQSISSDTWIEKATGNTIDIVASDAHVVIDANSSAEIIVSDGSNTLRLENNGTITNIQLNTSTEIEISGNSTETIPVQSNIEGTRIITSIPLDIQLEQPADIVINRGAENTVVSVPNAEALPTISGIGIIEVTIEDTNEIVEIVADNIAPTSDEDDDTIKGIIKGRIVTSEDTSVVVSRAAVYLIPFRSCIDGSESSLEAAIAAAEVQERCYVVQSNSNGEYETQSLPYGNYALIVKADGRSSYLQTIILNEAVFQNSLITMSIFTEDLGGVRGVILNASDARPVEEGINLILRRNANNVSGTIVKTTFTDNNGEYSFEDLESGTYTIQVVDERTDIQEESRYVRTSINVPILGGVTVTSDITVTKAIRDDQIRFVLTWGEESEHVARDLDSHLIGPASHSDIEKFHIYYSDRTYEYDEIKYADLDVDDVDWEGPETTTIYQKAEGIYHFYVYDFSNQSDITNMKLANSQAVVKVYAGNRIIATYNVPYEVGTLWDVCTYNSEIDELTAINQVYYFDGNSLEVGMEPIDIARRNLTNTINIAERVLETLAPEVKVEFQDIINEAKNSLVSTDISAMKNANEQLSVQIEIISNSTRIYNVRSNGTDLSFWAERYIAEWWYTDYSVLYVEGSEQDLESLELIFDSENTSYEKCESDIEYYDGLIIVSNSSTKVTERYYIKFYDNDDYNINRVNFNFSFDFNKK